MGSNTNNSRSNDNVARTGIMTTTHINTRSVRSNCAMEGNYSKSGEAKGAHSSVVSGQGRSKWQKQTVASATTRRARKRGSFDVTKPLAAPIPKALTITQHCGELSIFNPIPGVRSYFQPLPY